jgi:hypothetical protein
LIPKIDPRKHFEQVRRNQAQSRKWAKEILKIGEEGPDSSIEHDIEIGPRKHFEWVRKD